MHLWFILILRILFYDPGPFREITQLKGHTFPPPFTQMRGERMPQRVAGDTFVDPGHFRGLLDGAIHSAGMGVPADTASRVLIQAYHC